MDNKHITDRCARKYKIMTKDITLHCSTRHCLVDSCHHMSLSKSDGTCRHVAIWGGQLLIDLQPEKRWNLLQT